MQSPSGFSKHKVVAKLICNARIRGAASLVPGVHRHTQFSEHCHIEMQYNPKNCVFRGYGHPHIAPGTPTFYEAAAALARIILPKTERHQIVASFFSNVPGSLSLYREFSITQKRTSLFLGTTACSILKREPSKGIRHLFSLIILEAFRFM